MGRAFNQSTHREFEQSHGRERNTTPSVTVAGFRRRSLFASTEVTYYSNSGGANPSPPGGVVASDRTQGGTNGINLIKPSDYQGIFCSSSLVQGSTVFGTPRTFAGITWSTGLIFRIKLRVWGVSMLSNPWDAPLGPYDYTGTFPISTDRIWDANVRYQFRIGQNFQSQAPHGIDICLNAINPDDAGSSGDPKGLWRFERVITAYGQVTDPNPAALARGWDIASHGVNVPAGLVQPIMFNGIDRDTDPPPTDAYIAFQWHEPNPTLNNPAPPFSIALIPPAQQERASHLFDWRDKQFATSADQAAVTWCSNGLGCYLMDYAEAPSILPISYDDLVMERISQVRT